MNSTAKNLNAKLETKDAVIGVCGLGYVGLPLAMAAACVGYKVIGFDVNQDYVDSLKTGASHVGAVSDEILGKTVNDGQFTPTTDFSQLGDCDCILICVPTPLSKDRGPDLQFITATGERIAETLRPGQMIVLESTTYPGTTNELLKPMLEQTGLKSGTDFFLGFSPEREDPGNATHNTRTIPKVVSGDGKTAQQLVAKLYGAFITEVVPVSSNDTAEAVKLTENIFRSVNIALVNELKVIYSALDIDIWEVIDAAKTKPFGYMPFYPGPGLGGHCIPIDPFYLSWKAEQIGLKTRFIELAGEINISMPQYVIDKLAAALSTSHDKLLKGSNVIVIGLAYKKNISDIRESPSFALIELLQEKGVNVEFHDPFVDEIPPTREHAALAGRKSVALTRENIKATDAIVISTDHDNIDYQMLAENAALVIDSRNIMENNGLTGNNIIKA